MKKLLTICCLFLTAATFAQTNIFNPQTINLANRNQKAGKSMQVGSGSTDTLVVKGKTILDNLRGFGTGVVGIDNTGKLSWVASGGGGATNAAIHDSLVANSQGFLLWNDTLDRNVDTKYARDSAIAANAGGSGTVTSVGITSADNSVIINSGSPVTTAGDIDLTSNAFFQTNGAPTVNDDNTNGHFATQQWFDLNTGILYEAFNVPTGAATWVVIYDPSVISGWSLTGNTGTNPKANFIGTTDGVDLNIIAAPIVAINSLGYDTISDAGNYSDCIIGSASAISINGSGNLYNQCVAMAGSVQNSMATTCSEGLLFSASGGFAVNVSDHSQIYNSVALSDGVLDRFGSFNNIAHSTAINGGYLASSASNLTITGSFVSGDQVFGNCTNCHTLGYNVTGKDSTTTIGGNMNVLNGNVGIAITTPTEKLEVIGNVKADTLKGWHNASNLDTLITVVDAATDTIHDGYTGVMLTGAATTTTYTLVLPPAPYEGQRILIENLDNTFVAFTLDGNGQTLSATINTFVTAAMTTAGRQYTMRYKGGTWY